MTNEDYRQELRNAKQSLTELYTHREKLDAGITKKIKRIKQIQKQLSTQHRANGLVITDHALLRYAEIVLGFEPERYLETLTEQASIIHDLLGDGKYPLDDGITAVIKNRSIITIIPNDEDDSRSK